MSIKHKVATGLFWTFGQQFITVFLNFLVSVILARLLLPDQFGLLSMIAIFVSVGEVLMNGGLVSSLIRKEQPDQSDYSTVFFVNLLVSVLIYLILFFSAPLIASFFKQPMLVSLLRVYVATIIIYAFSTVPAARLAKNMDFKKLFTYHLPSLIIGGLTGVILAAKGYGVWSLVYMNLVQASLYSVQIWVLSGWMPDFTFHKERFREHFTFGSKLVLSLILDRVYPNIYNLVIGRFFSASELGYYSRSNTLALVPSENLYQALNKVSYPMLSSMQDNRERFVAVYKKLIQQSLFIVIPILSMLAITANPLFRVLLTAKWLPAVPYFRILCIVAVLETINGHSQTVLLVKGRSDLFLKLNIVEKVFVTCGIFAAIPFGIQGLLYLQVAASAFMFFFNAQACGKLIGYPVAKQMADMSRVLLISVLAGTFTFLLGRWMTDEYQYLRDDMVRVITLCIFYSGLYIYAFIVLKAPEIRDFQDMVLQALSEKYLVKKQKELYDVRN